MYRILIIFAGLATFAGPAAAGDLAAPVTGSDGERNIAVPIIGRDDAAVKADIRKAAAEVCRPVLYSNIMATMNERGCIRRAIAKAESDLTQARIANAQAAARYAAK